MFDAPANLPVEPTSKAPNAAGPRPNPPMPSVAPNALMKSPKGEPEDIFAGIEREAPGEATDSDVEAMGPSRSGKGQKTAMIILCIAAGVLLLVAGGIFLYRRFVVEIPESSTVPAAFPAETEEVPEEMEGVTIIEEPEAEPAVPPTPSFETEVPSVSEAETLDTDGDGLTDAEEGATGTDANSTDTDGDGLTDGTEVKMYGTNPLVADTDGDGISDGDEVSVWKTSPVRADTDGDGYADGEEIRNGYNPLGEGKLER